MGTRTTQYKHKKKFRLNFYLGGSLKREIKKTSSKIICGQGGGGHFVQYIIFKIFQPILKLQWLLLLMILLFSFHIKILISVLTIYSSAFFKLIWRWRSGESKWMKLNRFILISLEQLYASFLKNVSIYMLLLWNTLDFILIKSGLGIHIIIWHK